MLQCSLCKYATNNQRQQWKNYSVLFLVLYKDVLFHVCQSMQIICAICANQRIDIICDAFVREKFISSQTIAWPNQIQQLEIEISAKLTLIFVCFCRPLEPKSHVYTILLFVIIFHVHEHVLLKGKVSFDSNYCVICDNRTCNWQLFCAAFSLSIYGLASLFTKMSSSPPLIWEGNWWFSYNKAASQMKYGLIGVWPALLFSVLILYLMLSSSSSVSNITMFNSPPWGFSTIRVSLPKAGKNLNVKILVGAHCHSMGHKLMRTWFQNLLWGLDGSYDHHHHSHYHHHHHHHHTMYS